MYSCRLSEQARRGPRQSFGVRSTGYAELVLVSVKPEYSSSKWADMTEKNRSNILILEPERDTAELFTRALETHISGCKCYWVKTFDEAKSLLVEMSFAFVLADLSVLAHDHYLLLDVIDRTDGSTRVIVDGYLNQNEEIKKALKMGVAGYFIKPIKISNLRELIDDFTNNRPK